MPEARTAPDPDEPPDPADAEALRLILREGGLGAYPPGVVVAALRALPAIGEKELRRDLTLFLSDVIHGILRMKVKASFPNRGEDIIDEAHGRLLTALLDPGSSDGAAMEENFEARVHFRAIDAIRRHVRRAKVELPTLLDGPGEELDEDPQGGLGFGAIDVGQALALIGDARKRLAFSYAMHGYRRGEIARQMKVDVKTVYRWIEEVRSFLRTELKL